MFPVTVGASVSPADPIQKTFENLRVETKLWLYGSEAVYSGAGFKIVLFAGDKFHFSVHEIEVRSTPSAAAMAFSVLTEPDLRPVSISAK